MCNSVNRKKEQQQQQPRKMKSEDGKHQMQTVDVLWEVDWSEYICCCFSFFWSSYMQGVSVRLQMIVAYAVSNIYLLVQEYWENSLKMQNHQL